MSRKTLKNGHAEHIHANCDCQYAVRFDGRSTVEGYDPDALKAQYDSFEGTPQEKINAWRREHDVLHRDEINERKREAYERNRRLNYGSISNFETDSNTIAARRVDKYGHNNIYVDEKVALSERQLRKIDWQITEARRVLNIDVGFDAKVVVTNTANKLASYNPRTNILLISSKLTSDSEIIKAQSGFACPNDTRSTAVHELLHWKDADEYRKNGNVIELASRGSPYVQYRCDIGWDELNSAGFDLMNGKQIQTEISEYAWDKIRVDNDFDEAYTEYRTKIALEGS